MGEKWEYRSKAKLPFSQPGCALPLATHPLKMIKMRNQRKKTRTMDCSTKNSILNTRHRVFGVFFLLEAKLVSDPYLNKFFKEAFESFPWRRRRCAILCFCKSWFFYVCLNSKDNYISCELHYFSVFIFVFPSSPKPTFTLYLTLFVFISHSEKMPEQS